MSTEFGYIGGNAPTQSGQNNSGLINPKDMYELVTTDKLKFDSMYRHILTEEISGSPSTLDYTDERLTKYPNLLVIGNNLQASGSNIYYLDSLLMEVLVLLIQGIIEVRIMEVLFLL